MYFKLLCTLFINAKNFKQGYKVSISGTGADELFSGYYDHHLAYLYELNIKKIMIFNHLVSHGKSHISPIVRNPFLKNGNILLIIH